MFCKAPSNNMYLGLKGFVTPCWGLSTDRYSIDHWSKEKGLSDIWFGEKFENKRTQLKNEEYVDTCLNCKKQRDNGELCLANAYDKFTVKKYPSLLEVEISNICNLECIMCDGVKSSSIRKNRDKLEPIKQVYNDALREQLKEFIPHLEEIRFNGGEPFTHKLVYDICEDISEMNPACRVSFATNGTVLTKKVKDLLEKTNVILNISVDSLIKERYEKIRVNGNLDKWLANFEYFNNYCKERKRNLTIAVNPMRQNWDEMLDIGKWSHENDVGLWYNTILEPESCALWNLSTDELNLIYKTLHKQLFKMRHRKNYPVMHNLVEKQIKNWLLDSYTR